MSKLISRYNNLKEEYGIKKVFTFFALFLAGIICSGYGLLDSVVNTFVTQEELIIVVDAGHGGIDPGKVGINDVLEKDINLQIALKLKKTLEQSGFKVIMTRSDDNGLYNDSDKNKKIADMKKRVSIINESKAVFAISIHQNSFSQASSKGAQVFYYKQSDKSKEAAGIIQQCLKEFVQKDNNREHKANLDYYLLKKTIKPTVIVECGFLSNEQELKLLISEEYQDKIVWAINYGIIEYINKELGNENI